jgi:phosphohistidine phosphatase
MKTLLLMRHAKSSWKEPEIPDQERPINKRGRRDAPTMAHVILEKELVPQLIVSSTATRARQTADILLSILQHGTQVEYLDAFYLAEPLTYLEILRSQSNDFERIMVVGHNPGLEALLQILSGDIVALPTSAIAHLVLPIEKWADMSADIQGELVEVLKPKDIEEQVEEEKEKKDKKANKEKKVKKEKKAEKSEKKKDKDKDKDKEKVKDKDKDKEKVKGKDKDKKKKEK